MVKVRHKVFGKNSNPTIYYFTGYTTFIKQYRPHIYSLLASGYRVVVFDYDRSVLLSGDPQALPGALKQVKGYISKDIKGRKIAGVYGISLGTWFAENVMLDFDIPKGVLNSAGCSLPGAIWHRPMMEAEKAMYQKNGVTRDSLEEAWRPYNVLLQETGFTGKQLLVMNSVADEVVDIHESRETMENWRRFGNEVEFIEISKLKHSRAIARNMFRVGKVKQFFTDY